MVEISALPNCLALSFCIGIIMFAVLGKITEE